MQHNETNQATRTTSFVDQGKLEPEHIDAQSIVPPYTSRTAQSNDRTERQDGEREFNKLNELYAIPADEPEWVRLSVLLV